MKKIFRIPSTGNLQPREIVADLAEDGTVVLTAFICEDGGWFPSTDISMPRETVGQIATWVQATLERKNVDQKAAR